MDLFLSDTIFQSLLEFEGRRDLQVIVTPGAGALFVLEEDAIFPVNEVLWRCYLCWKRALRRAG
jgi:hypothetical protein